jgi:hypothetical protein
MKIGCGFLSEIVKMPPGVLMIGVISDLTTTSSGGFPNLPL